MIYIDDAGSGSLIGGTIIGAFRIETKEYHYDIIPLKYYTSQYFNNKAYLDHASEITVNLLEKLQFDFNEEIRVCRGYMFDKFRVWLKENNCNYKNVKIGDPLQTKIENTFEEYTINLGFPKRFISYTKYPFHFHRILSWVFADYENRVHLCKTGWRSWNKYGSQDINKSIIKINKSKYICLKCNNRIKDNSYVQVLKFISNRPHKIYLHQDC